MPSVSTLDGGPCPGRSSSHPGWAPGEAFLQQGSQAGIGSEPATAVRLTSFVACGELVATVKRQRSMVQGEGGGDERGKGVRQEEPAAMVSLLAEVPEPLLRAMRGFIELHPNWDQYRLFQAALAGFLVQNGVHDRAVTRCYLANLFPGGGRFAGPPAPLPAAQSPPPSSPPSPTTWPRRRSHRSSPPGPADLGRRAA